MTVAEFATRLELMRKNFEFSVTSWFRSVKRNAKVGGHPNSKHLIGLGADIIPDNFTILSKFRSFAALHDISVLDEGDHWHLQPTSRKKYESYT